MSSRPILCAKTSCSSAFSGVALRPQTDVRYVEPSPNCYAPCGKRFKGDESIRYPQIGSVYLCHIDGFDERYESSATRPMMLVGYYKKDGKVVACDFACTASFAKFENGELTSERYNVPLPVIQLASFSKQRRLLECGSIITLPNNPDCVSKAPIGAIPCNILPDYFLRRALVAYEEKLRWKKGALIPDGAVRHGFTLDGLDQNLFKCGLRLSPDVRHPDHNFEHAVCGPKFMMDCFQTVMSWATSAHRIREYFKRDVDVPEIRSFPNWPNLQSFVAGFSSQVRHPT